MWSYQSQLETPLDRIRFAIQDIDENDPLFQNEEIETLLNQNSEGSVIEILLNTLIMRFSREVDYTIGPEKVSASQKYKQYVNLLDIYRKNSNLQGHPELFNNCEIDKASTFYIGMHDNAPNC